MANIYCVSVILYELDILNIKLISLLLCVTERIFLIQNMNWLSYFCATTPLVFNRFYFFPKKRLSKTGV